MPVVKIEPTDEHPLPYSLAPEEPEAYLDQVSIAAKTADLLEELGAPDRKSTRLNSSHT